MKISLSTQLLILLAVATFIQDVICITCSGHDDASQDEDFEDIETPEPGNTKPLKGARCQKKNQQYRTFKHVSSGGVVPLECGRCLVNDVQVKVSRGKNCVGWTPELYGSKLNCLWKNSCKLQYTPSSIITKDSRFECFFHVPDQVEVGYSCLNPVKTPIVDVIPPIKVKAEFGLLRSHDRSDKRDKYPTGSYGLKKHKFNITLPETSTSAYVLLKTISNSLVHGDTIVLINEVCGVTLDKPPRDRTYDHNITTSRLDLEFTLREDSPGAHGFDICFQWFSFDHSDPEGTFKKTVSKCEAYSAKSSSEEFPVYDVIKSIRSNSAVGVILSHPDYPWNYRPLQPYANAFSEIGGGPSYSSVYRVLTAPSEKHKVVRITVKDMGIARDDKLELLGNGRSISPQNDLQVVYNLTAREVTVNFTIRNTVMGRPKSRGFLLYYQWLEWDEDTDVTFEHQANVCKKGRRMIPSACKVRKQRKKKKGKKKGSKKKGKRTKKKGTPATAVNTKGTVQTVKNTTQTETGGKKKKERGAKKKKKKPRAGKRKKRKKRSGQL